MKILFYALIGSIITIIAVKPSVAVSAIDSLHTALSKQSATQVVSTATTTVTEVAHKAKVAIHEATK